MKSICRAESILFALPKSLGKSNVIEAFDRSYPQSTLMTELAKPTNLARWAILAIKELLLWHLGLVMVFIYLMAKRDRWLVSEITSQFGETL